MNLSVLVERDLGGLFCISFILPFIHPCTRLFLYLLIGIFLYFVHILILFVNYAIISSVHPVSGHIYLFYYRSVYLIHVIPLVCFADSYLLRSF